MHTYAELWHASRCVLEAGERCEQGSAWQFLSSAVLTAFAFEAYLNHTGARTIACWPELEGLSPWDKLERLCDALGVSFPDGTGKRPLQTIGKMLDFRNTLAHGRSESLAAARLRDNNDRLDAYIGARLLTDWERLIQSSDFATRVRDDVAKVLHRLHAARRDDKEPLFTSGVSAAHARLA